MVGVRPMSSRDWRSCEAWVSWRRSQGPPVGGCWMHEPQCWEVRQVLGLLAHVLGHACIVGVGSLNPRLGDQRGLGLLSQGLGPTCVVDVGSVSPRAWRSCEARVSWLRSQSPPVCGCWIHEHKVLGLWWVLDLLAHILEPACVACAGSVSSMDMGS